MKASYMRIGHYFSLILFTVVTTFVGSVAFAGDADGGGAGKPPVSFGIENFNAILNDAEVLSVLGLNLEVLEIRMTTRSGAIRTYEVIADNVNRSNKCVFTVDVQNEHSTLVKDVMVVKLEVLEGCGERNVKQAPSTLSMFKNYFDKYSAFSPIDENRLYSDYIKLAQDTPLELRKRIIAHMQTSNEKRFAALFQEKSKNMQDFVLRNPGITVGGFYSYLGKLMGLETSQGVVIPVLIGLEIAPLFIVNN